MIDPLLAEIFQSTPRTVDQDVAAFCASINRTSTPIFLRPVRLQDSVPGECYENVAKACAATGGAGISGWLIWLWPGVMIEAEHHMVMQINDGLVDVSPPPDHEEIVLFLPDPNTPFNRVTRQIIPSRQSVLAPAKIAQKVQTMIDAAAAMKALSGDTFGAMVSVSQDIALMRQRNFLKAKSDLIAALRAITGRNDPCFCGGGNKFKKCHGIGL